MNEKNFFKQIRSNIPEDREKGTTSNGSNSAKYEKYKRINERNEIEPQKIYTSSQFNTSMRKVFDVIEMLELKLGRIPTVDEIYDNGGIFETREVVDQILNLKTRGVSLDANPENIFDLKRSEEGHYDNYSTTDLYDIIMNKNAESPDDNLNKESKKIMFKEAFSLLSPRERDIISLHYGIGSEPRTRDQIQEEFGYSKDEISKKLGSGLDKLKKIIKENKDLFFD